MMTAERDEVFFNENEPIKGKIELIKKVLYNTFNTVKIEESLAWD